MSRIEYRTCEAVAAREVVEGHSRVTTCLCCGGGRGREEWRNEGRGGGTGTVCTTPLQSQSLVHFPIIFNLWTKGFLSLRHLFQFLFAFHINIWYGKNILYATVAFSVQPLTLGPFSVCMFH